MRLHTILASLTLLFAVGCPADDDDSSGDDDAADDDAGDDDAADDDAGDDDAADDDTGDDDSGESPWAGSHDGGFAGEGQGGGLFAATISDTGALTLDGETSSGDVVTGTGQVEDAGGAVIAVEVADPSDKVLIDGTGNLRTEGGDQLGFGSWTSSDGGSGVWALWPPDFDSGFTPQELETGCGNSTQYCGSPVMSAQLCADMARCQGGFMAAHSTECADVYHGFMQLFVDMDGPEDCPDFGQPLPGWVEHDCPEMFSACGVLMP